MSKRYTSKQREQLIETVRTSGESVRAVTTRMGVTVSTAESLIPSNKNEPRRSLLAPQMIAGSYLVVGVSQKYSEFEAQLTCLRRS